MAVPSLLATPLPARCRAGLLAGVSTTSPATTSSVAPVLNDRQLLLVLLPREPARLTPPPQQQPRALPLGTFPGLPARVLLACQFPWAAAAPNGTQLLPLHSGLPCPLRALWEPKEIPEELEQGGTAGSPGGCQDIHGC